MNTRVTMVTAKMPKMAGPRIRRSALLTGTSRETSAHRISSFNPWRVLDIAVALAPNAVKSYMKKREGKGGISTKDQ